MNVLDAYSENPLALVEIIDITLISKYESQKSMEKMKTLYFASIAHDLRTPINTIMGTNQILQIQYEDK